MLMNKINEEGTYLIVVCEVLFKHFTNIYSFNSHNSLQSTCYNDPISQMGKLKYRMVTHTQDHRGNN